MNTGDDWSTFRVNVRVQRSENRALGVQFLRQRKMDFVSWRGDAHLVVTCCPGRIVDFWPGTALWVARFGNYRGHGARALCEFIEEFKKKELGLWSK